LLNFHFRLPTLKVIGESTAWALTVCLQTSLSAPLAPPVLSHGASLQVAWPSVPCPPSATDPKPPVTRVGYSRPFVHEAYWLWMPVVATRSLLHRATYWAGCG